MNYDVFTVDYIDQFTDFCLFTCPSYPTTVHQYSVKVCEILQFINIFIIPQGCFGNCGALFRFGNRIRLAFVRQITKICWSSAQKMQILANNRKQILKSASILETMVNSILRRLLTNVIFVFVFLVH